jgi:hypothetical protein
LRGVGEPFAVTPGRGEEVGRHAVAERDGAGLVEQEHVDVACGFDGAAGGGHDVAADERSMPLMPMALSRPPMVVGMRHTSSAMSTGMEKSIPA